MVIVQHQGERAGRFGQEIDQPRERGFDGWRIGGLDAWEKLLTHVGTNRLQSGADIAPEARRIVVRLVQREPGQRTLEAVRGLSPLTEERGFACSRRGADEREFALKPLVYSFEQARARNQAVHRSRELEFRGQQRILIRY